MIDHVPGEWVHFVQAASSSLIVILIGIILYIAISRVLRTAENKGTLKMVANPAKG
jgi:hypothetical protein